MQDCLLDFLNDEAIYRRTALGQKEPTDHLSRLSPIEKRFLRSVTGHTPLRLLLDLGLDDPGIGAAIVGLAKRGLVVQVNDAV